MLKSWKMRLILLAIIALFVAGCVLNTEGVDIKKTTIDTKDVGVGALDPT
jgi:PBP1b-binding outer membrane lipoprotein LpoB|tara:strand:- start:2220 stop:2369 length:150 start_codon:yes stop_codon:yes gene_type:complete